MSGVQFGVFDRHQCKFLCTVGGSTLFTKAVSRLLSLRGEFQQTEDCPKISHTSYNHGHSSSLATFFPIGLTPLFPDMLQKLHRPLASPTDGITRV
jgi:hypothetical protein